MSEDRRNEDGAVDERRPRTRRGFWFGIVIGGLAGAVAAGALVSAAGVAAAPFAAARAIHGQVGHFGGGRFADDPERAREHVEFATDWILSRVDATDDQKAQARQIADRTLDSLLPLAQTHRENREALATELTKADIDPAAIERIRQSEVGLVDSVSKELTSALTGIAETLTPEQRNQLLEEAHRFHR